MTRTKLGFTGLGYMGSRIAKQLVDATDVLLSCLADEQSVRNVYLGAGGVWDYARRGAVIIEMSAIAPETSQHLYEGRMSKACS